MSLMLNGLFCRVFGLFVCFNVFVLLWVGCFLVFVVELVVVRLKGVGLIV